MKIIGIDHIGIAVKEIGKAAGFYENVLGLPIAGEEAIVDRQLKIAFLETGNARLELIEPTSDDSTIAKFLANRGEGIHHFCLLVDDIEQALQEMSQKGYRLIDETPRQGAEGSKIAFVHPSTAGGVLIELKQLADKKVSQK